MRSRVSATAVAQFQADLEEIERRCRDEPRFRKNRFYLGPLPDCVGNLYRSPELVGVVTAILGTDDIALYLNRVLIKDPHWRGEVSVHQDCPYFSGSTDKVSLFVPLEPMGARNGGMVFLAKSHRYGLMQRGTIKLESFDLEPIAPEMSPGDVAAMDFFTWHYSVESIEPSPRPILQIVYQRSSDGTYCPEHGVAEPTLVCGEWRTDRFLAYSRDLVASDA